MPAGLFEFRPQWRITLVTIISFLLLLALGCWQLERAEEKEHVRRQHLDRSSGEPIRLNDLDQGRTEKDHLLWSRTVSRGSYSQHYHFLLDNQVMNTEPGYFVYTPFRLEGGQGWVLVNRGWVSIGHDRGELPQVAAPAGEVDIRGLIREPFRPGILLGEESYEQVSTTTYRIQRLDINQIEAHTGLAILPFTVLLDAGEPHGFTREWRMPGSGRERHLGYAFQWFALALTLLVIYVAVNLKKMVNADEQDSLGNSIH